MSIDPEDQDMHDIETVLSELNPTFEGDILKSGVDLNLHKQEVERQLKYIETACIADYMKESENITDLFKRVASCDDILKNLETILCKFQADLGNICQEIIVLHDQTVSLNLQLKNKQAVRGKLGKFIDDMTIPPVVSKHIMYTAIPDKNFIDNLEILDKKVHFFKEQDFKDAKSCNDVQLTLSGLKAKAIFKIREYLLRKIQDCRKYLSNYQVPKEALLQNKLFYKFLLSHEREKAREIQNEYIDTMSKVYYSYFKEYITRLSKLEYYDKPDENDLMGSDETCSKTKTSLLFSMKPTSLKNKSTVFTLGDRFSVLTTDLEALLIMPKPSTKDSKYTTEAIFRSIHYATLDNSSKEYFFLQEFFMTSGDIQTNELFHSVLGKTLSLLQSYVIDQFKSSYDSIAAFLCLHLVYRYREMAHRSKVFVLDKYWDSVTKFLYPRIEKIIQMQIQSVKNCDCSKSANVDTMPHPVVRRYAEYASALMSINDTYPDERISILLEELQFEIKSFILRTAAIFVHPKEELIFMINNYDHILSVFKRSNVRDDSKDNEEIASQLTKRTQEIVEELLYPHFGSIICFVKDCEVFFNSKDVNSLKNLEPRVSNLIRSFMNERQKALGSITKEVMDNFTNFENGSGILQAVLDEIVQFYDRFLKVISKEPFITNHNRNDLLSLTEFKDEVRKIGKLF